MVYPKGTTRYDEGSERERRDFPKGSRETVEEPRWCALISEMDPAGVPLDPDPYIPPMPVGYGEGIRWREGEHDENQSSYWGTDLAGYTWHKGIQHLGTYHLEIPYTLTI